jgi:hypothetical protein
MQNIRSDPLTTFQASELLATIQDVLDDSDLLTSITLKNLTSQTVDVETGVVTRTSTDDTVNALRRIVSAEEVAQAGGALELDDRVYIVEQADLTNDPQTVDRIVEGTEVLSVFNVEADPLDQVWQIWARIA